MRHPGGDIGIWIGPMENENKIKRDLYKCSNNIFDSTSKENMAEDSKSGKMCIFILLVMPIQQPCNIFRFANHLII